MTKKILSRDSIYIVDVVMSPKFGSIYIREVVIKPRFFKYLTRRTAFLRVGIGSSSVILD